MKTNIRTYDLFDTKRQLITRNINNYVKLLPVIEPLKDKILSFDFINDNPSYYVDYPYLFIKKTIDERKIDNLCIAGALYYQSIILLDRVFDKDLPFEALFPIINICQEETVKILTELIGKKSSFWMKWNTRKMEYLQAFEKDKSHAIYSFENFETHVDNKSALGKVAIDALWELGEITSYELYTTLLEIHKYFYCAFQILDDISDIKEDFSKKQFNVIIWQIKEAVLTGILPEEALNNAENTAKYFYLSDIRKSMYKKALSYVDKAYSLSVQHNLSYMISEESRLWNTIVVQYLNINAYIKELETSLILSEEVYRRETINSAISDGIFFINSCQEENGSWIDFCNNAGTSDTWSTAFVLFMLSEAGEKNIKAVNYLLEHKKDELWGYNTNWITDNDSSIIGLLALQATENINMDINLLIKRFNKDGGVSTYFNNWELVSSLSNVRNWNINVNGWMQSHLCVSAAALLLLTRNKNNSAEMKELLKYIKQKLEEKIQAYWWIDNIYILFFLMKSNIILKDTAITNCLKIAIDKKVREYHNEHSVFYKSLLLYLLCANELIYIQYKKEAEIIAQEILNIQYSDGSWKASNFMCIPSTETLNPEEPENWEIADTGINIRAHEFHRLFTTSTAIMALKQYLEYRNA